MIANVRTSVTRSPLVTVFLCFGNVRKRALFTTVPYSIEELSIPPVTGDWEITFLSSNLSALLWARKWIQKQKCSLLVDCKHTVYDSIAYLAYFPQIFFFFLFDHFFYILLMSPQHLLFHRGVNFVFISPDTKMTVIHLLCSRITEEETSFIQFFR